MSISNALGMQGIVFLIVSIVTLCWWLEGRSTIGRFLTFAALSLAFSSFLVAIWLPFLTG